MSSDIPCPNIQDRVGSSPIPDSGQGAEGNDEISLLDCLIFLGERKRQIVTVAAASAVIAATVSFLLPVRYTATVTLLPPQQNSSVSAALTSQLGSLGGVAALGASSLGLKNPNDMYVGMLTSRTVEDAMIQNFGLMHEYKAKYPSDARKAFEGHVTVDDSGKDNLIRISVDDHDPKRAAELANGYVDQFRKLSANLAITEASQRRLFFEQQLELAKDSLANAEEALKATEQKTGVIQIDSQARALIESAESLRAQIAAQEVQIQSIKTFANGENSQLIQAEQELQSMRAQLAKLGGTETAADTDMLVPKGQVPEASLEYVRRLRDVKYNETIFDILARQFEVAKIDEARQGAVIQVVDVATPPDRKSFPRRTLIIIVATAAGLLVGVLVAWCLAVFKLLEKNSKVASKIKRLRQAFSL